MSTESFSVCLLLVCDSENLLSVIGCSLNQDFTVTVLSKTRPKAFYYHYHQIAVLIREKVPQPDLTSEGQSKG